MRLILIIIIFSIVACSGNKEDQQKSDQNTSVKNLSAMLDTIWLTEQTPIRLRDSLMKIHGAESLEVQKQQEIYEKNHLINEKKITKILDEHGWPSAEIVDQQGNLVICNVIQHSDMETRLKYLPLMREAVKDKKLQPRLLARAEDRLATDRGDLQVYGGQIKYYPETKTFNVWPIMDPENVDKRRAEIGLEPIAEFLKRKKVSIEWNVEEQIKRTEKFKAAKQ